MFGCISQASGNGFPVNEYEDIKSWSEMAEDLRLSASYFQEIANKCRQMAKYCERKSNEES